MTRLGVIALAAICITTRAADEPPAPAAAAATPVAAGAPATPAPAKPEPAELKTFKDVIKGAKEHPGFLTLWQKDEKVWIEIPNDLLGKPIFFEANISDSLGERAAYASQMGYGAIVVFKRIGNTMQLILKNTDHRAAPGSPAERAVDQAFSDSLAASAPVVSKPDPEHKSVLVDANVLLFNDFLSYATRLEGGFHLSYTLDRNNSSFNSIRADSGITTFNVSAHFTTNRLPAFVAPGNPFPPNPPQSVPDARSIFIGFVYSLMPLPAVPMAARKADDRIGYFQTDIADYSTDNRPNARIHYINRWRLEKKDPDAALSEPKEPIVYWIDRNVPEHYRQTVADGILEWNKAFERIGFKNAIVVRIQPDDADFDTLDSRHASVRWFLGDDVGFAIGPHVVDPRTGEILDADIAISDVFTRGARFLISEILPPRAGEEPFLAIENRSACTIQAGAAEELDFGMDLLEARGEIDPDSPEAEKFALAYLKSIVTHEVGHTLGLRHNFRASTIRTPAQLENAAFTATHGFAGSVMDYLPFNIAVDGEPQGEYVMSGLGPYDYWAIEYGYRPLDPAHETEELQKIAARNTEPELAFATDEDANGKDSSDPEVNQFDLGSEPLDYYKKRFQLTHELWARLQARQLKPGEDYLILRRNMERGFREIERMAPLVAKYVGGVHTTRDHAGTGRPLAEPVTPAQQRQALDLLTAELFSEHSIEFSSEFTRRLGIDYLDRGQPSATNTASFDLAERLLKIQSDVLDRILSDPVADRILDARSLAGKSEKTLTLPQLYDALQASIWSELNNGREIVRARRNLQRVHLKHLVATLLKTSKGTLADVHSLQRAEAVALRASAARALAKGKLSRESTAHLEETIATIDQALKATPTRDGA